MPNTDSGPDAIKPAPVTTESLAEKREMNQEKGKRPSLKVKLMLVVALGIIYGWTAPKWLAPHRHDPSSFPLFIGLQLITMGTAIIFTLGRKPGRAEIATLILVVFVWVYLFFFVMLNSFGS